MARDWYIKRRQSGAAETIRYYSRMLVPRPLRAILIHRRSLKAYGEHVTLMPLWGRIF